MIGTLSGTIRHTDINMVIVDVNGVGYKVFTNADAALAVTPGEPAFFWTYLAVRETALDLYGFAEKETLELFELLITVSGIGPKTALGILNIATPGQLRQAIASEDPSLLVKTSGIGRKSAEKIVLELKGKIVATASDVSESSRSESDAIAALVSLGYNDRDARDALKRVSKDITGTSERVKAALKNLSTDR